DNPTFQSPDGPGGGGGSDVGGGSIDIAAPRPDLMPPAPIVDLATAPDLMKPGGVGSACKTACDCEPGLACVSNKCAKPAFGGVIYCCDNLQTCPAGQTCQGADGRMGRCPTPPPPDGGGPMWCQ